MHKILATTIFTAALLALGQEHENLPSENLDDQTCDASREDCDSSLNAEDNSPSDHWTPFRYQSTGTVVDFNNFYSAYVKWHNKTLFSSKIPCDQKKILVFSPNAGLGDSIGALTSGFHYAIKTGRLFFIDWKPYQWAVGLRPLKFFYNYRKAATLLNPDTRKPLLCCDKSKDPSAFLLGHVTNQHKLTEEPVINNQNFAEDKLFDILLQPSKKVKQIIENTTAELNQLAKKQKIEFLKVGLVIRTGVGEYNQFLSEGDEMNFIKCFRNYATTTQKKSKEKINFLVFVTSDNVSVKKKVVKELKDGDNGDLSINVLTLNDSIIHVMHVDKERENVKAKIRKTHAEFFLIGSCEVLFLTHGSLFGMVAGKRGKVKEHNTNFISDSQCDGKREKYSYLQCHNPKYPNVCGF